MLERLPSFAAEFGADFYRLPRNEERITLIRDTWTPPAAYPFGDGELVPLAAGEPIAWRLASEIAARV